MSENQEKMIKFNFTTMSWEGLTVEQIQLWEHLYEIPGGTPVVDQLRIFMPMWLEQQVLSRSPLKITRKGRKKNWKKFAAKWFARTRAREVGIL